MPDSAPFADAWRAGASAVRGSLLPIEASGVVFEAAGRRLIDGVDLRLEDRALTVVMGPNGAGKKPDPTPAAWAYRALRRNDPLRRTAFRSGNSQASSHGVSAGGTSSTFGPGEYSVRSADAR